MKTINAIWIGSRLGNVQVACLTSFVRQGYDVVLHSFGEVEDQPREIRSFNGYELMSEAELADFQRFSNLTAASDIYRLRLLREGMGIYVDCDVFCLRPFPETDYLLGWEGDDSVNNAVLDMPADCPMLADMLACANDPSFIPPWFKKKSQRRIRLKHLFGQKHSRGRLPFATFGPLLLSRMVKKHGLESKVLPPDAFYPLHHSYNGLLMDPELSLEDLYTRRSYCLHLSNSVLDLPNITAEKMSPMEEIVERMRPVPADTV